MAWGSRHYSTREWQRLRQAILERDHHICHVCHRAGADQVDHLISRADGGSDHPSNLAAIHARPCHAKRSSMQGNAAANKYTARRPPERHPGLTR